MLVDGKIEEIGIIDLKMILILLIVWINPTHGFCDLHVHFRDPGMEIKKH